MNQLFFISIFSVFSISTYNVFLMSLDKKWIQDLTDILWSWISLIPSFTWSYLVIFLVQSYPAHFTTSNQFLFCPLILSWYLFVPLDFLHLQIWHCPPPQISYSTHMQQYMQVPRLLCYRSRFYILNTIKRKIKYGFNRIVVGSIWRNLKKSLAKWAKVWSI